MGVWIGGDTGVGPLGIVLTSALLSCCGGTLPLGRDGVVTGSSDDHRTTVARAVAIADGVYQDAHFWELVAKRPWLAGPNEDSGARVIGGVEVRHRLESLRPSEQTYKITTLAGSWIPFLTGGTNAKTAVCGTISLDRKHLDPLMLVNTVAHENTHIVGRSSCDSVTSSYFTDGEHPDAIEVWLVSYGVGDLAECYWLYHGRDQDVATCMRSMKDGVAHGKRRQLECCACGPPGYADSLVKLRQESGLCDQVACSNHCSGDDARNDKE